MSLISCYTDTETTGLNPFKGDRIVEVCCILTVDFEIVDTFHTLINPERPVGFSATIHGHADDKLRDAPVFSDISKDLKHFIKQADNLIAYNAPFDVKFLKHEFNSRGFGPFNIRNQIDVLGLAKSVFPGEKNKLLNVIERLGIDYSSEQLHTALSDTKLLIQVHKELLTLLNKNSGLI